MRNTYANDAAEIHEMHSANRVGRRIRAIRTEHVPAMSQTDLGQLIGLNANRVQQYENGARKPKLELAQKIASALGVETSALLDPVVSTNDGVMYALFEMEKVFDLRLKEIDGEIYICFGDRLKHNQNELNYNLKMWLKRQEQRDQELEAAKTDEERDKILHDYHMWEWTFPRAVLVESDKVQERARLEKEIQELQEQLDKLKKSGDSGTTE